MPINLAVSKNKNLFGDLWFKMDEVVKIELGEDQRHLKDLNYTVTNITSIDSNVTAWSKPDGNPFKDGVRLFKCDKRTQDNNKTHSKEFFRKVTQLIQETSVKNNSKQFKTPYTTVKWLKSMLSRVLMSLFCTTRGTTLDIFQEPTLYEERKGEKIKKTKPEIVNKKKEYI